MAGMPPGTPTRLGHPLPFLSPVSPGSFFLRLLNTLFTYEICLHCLHLSTLFTYEIYKPLPRISNTPQSQSSGEEMQI